MFLKIVFVACVCCVLSVRCEGTEKEPGWSPSSIVFANSSVAWYPPRKDEPNFRTKSLSPRAFTLDTGENNNNNNNHLDGIDRAFEFNGISDREDFKAVPISGLSDTQTNPSSSSGHFHTVIKPAASQVFAPQSSYSAPQQQPQTSYGAPQQQQSYYPSSYYGAPSNSYLPPSTSQTLHIETLDSYQPVYNTNATAAQLELNTKSQLFIQPGKCSNSIEVGRVRDVEVRTAFKYGTDIQKGVCVLMLYAANELNKLAIALQPVQGTTNIVPTGSWLETNVKIYALQAGEIQPIITTLVNIM